MHNLSLDATAGPRSPVLGLPGFSYADLHDARRLADLTAAFDRELSVADPALSARYAAHRDGSARLSGPDESEFLVALGAHVSRFVGRLFGVEAELMALR